MENYLRWYLLLYLLVYMGLAFVLPSYRVWKQTGINPFVFTDKDTAHDFAGKMMKLLIALLFFGVSIHTFSSSFYLYLVPILYLETQVIKIIGLILLHLSLFWTIAAQFQMQKSWRIGIDEVHKTDLVQEGIFQLSRNPIFLGMLISVLGLFLILPNALLLSVLFGTFIVLQLQVRLEEEFLQKQHGEKYLTFCRKARRWL
jgi:protein-S-isoprenylcysteine O-methyltransferase Ste14